MLKTRIITHITNELLAYKNSQSIFTPFDIISKGILVNALMNFYVPQEFRIFHTGGTKMSGEVHIEPMLKHNESYKIHFNVTKNKIEIKLLEDGNTIDVDFVEKYNRAMKGI